MKKQNLRKLALFGLASGLVISAQSPADEPAEPTAEQQALIAAVHHRCNGPNGCPGLMADRDRSNSDTSDPNNGNMNYHVMTEEELLLELNEKGRSLYRSLDPSGKKLARLVASQYCNGTNLCEGLNGCQTDKNKCAGQGACRGTSKCSFSDKNLAVKVVSEKMAKKRNKALLESLNQE